MKQELKPPPLMPRFGLGDIVTVVGEYESDWGGQKLIITGIDYRPKQDLLTYQTHLAEAPESEGGTDGWTETDLSLYQHNKLNTRPTPPADAMMGEITGETSDGYHTFNELYEHRHILFLALLMSNRDKAWRSKLHSDGTMFDGWFIAGIETALGQATYHLPERIWSLFDAIKTMDKAPEWDGHTSNDVVERIREHALHPAPVTDAQREALDALGWLRISLDMSHTEWCDSASWRDDFQEKCDTISAALTNPAQAQDDPVNILIDALKFYATKEHWMAQTEDGDRLLLVAKGQSSLDHGWAEAHSAMQRYAIAAHYHLTPKTQEAEG